MKHIYKHFITLICTIIFGCFQVTGQGLQLKISGITSSVATCNAENGAMPISKKTDGSIKVSWIGGIGKYKVSLFNSYNSLIQSHQDVDQYWYQFDGLISGDYSVKIEDASSNITDTVYTLLSKIKLNLYVISYPVNCKGESDGKIRLEVNTTTKYVTFELKNLQYITTTDTNTTFTDLAGGYYYAKVTNSDGCIDSTQKVLIYEPKALFVTDSVTNVNKYGDTTGKIQVVITGGASPYKFSFSDNNNVKLDSGRTPSQILKKGLASGNYNFIIADANNCRVNLKNIFVWQPEQLVLSSQYKNVSCYGKKDASISLSAKGGIGDYTFGINDSVTGITKSYSNLSASSSPYVVFVRDSVGTEEKLEIYISQPDNLVSEVEKAYTLKCNNDNSGAIKLNITGGTSPYYTSTDSSHWIPGDSVGKLAASNSLKLFIKDYNNCQTSAIAIVYQPEVLSLKLDSIVRPLCQTNEGAIYTSASGGTLSGKYNYQWLYVDSSTIVNNLDNYFKNIYSGEYIVKVSDDNSCSDTINVMVSNLNDQHFDSVLLHHISCYDGNDGMIEIFVSGGTPEYRYYLNEVETEKNTTRLKTGSYKVKSIDSEGCIILSKVILTQPDSISVISKITEPVCFDTNNGSIVLAVSGGTGDYSYKWTNGDTTSTIVQIGKGNYRVGVTDSKNCSVTKSFEVTAPSAPTAKWPENKMVICTGNNLTLDGGDYSKYEWYKDLSLIDTVNRYIIIDQTGQYKLNITDINGCQGTDTFWLEVSDHPLEAILLLPDSAFVGEMARTIDVTWPVPDSIKWYYDKPVQIDSTNAWSESFVSTSEGLINVTLRAYSGGCFSDSSKTIMYHDTIKYDQKKAREERLFILEYTLFPNPNNGVFNIGIKLSNIAQVRLSLYAAGELLLIDQKMLEGQDYYTMNFNNKSLKPGTYLLLLETGNNKQTRKFIKF